MEQQNKIDLITRKIEVSKKKFKLKKTDKPTDNNVITNIDDLLIEKFLIDFCTKYDGTFELDNKDFYFLFLNFIKIDGINLITTPIKFGVKISNLKIDGITTGRRTNIGMTRKFDTNKIKDYYKK